MALAYTTITGSFFDGARNPLPGGGWVRPSDDILDASGTLVILGTQIPVSVAGQDTAHTVSLTTAASIPAGSSVATVTYGLSYAASSLTPRVALTPTGEAAALAQPYITAGTQAGYSVALASPPAGATAMTFDVHVTAS